MADSTIVPRPTLFLEPGPLAVHLDTDLVLAVETFQHTGSFKFRAAYNVARSVPNPHIITASSGNFGQAIALACRIFGKRCAVVMPDKSAHVKVDAVRAYGGVADLIDVREQSRAARVRELGDRHPDAYVASAYDDPLVIQGNATLGQELARGNPPFDAVVVPVGGGVLSAGLITGLQESGSPARVFGAEPLQANDAARSLRAGRIIANEREPATLADGARTISLGQHNWPILRRGLSTIFEIPEHDIIQAAQLLFRLANLKAEPTGALSVAALLAKPPELRGKRVCCVVSGGNVDPDVYRELLGSPARR
jgi:threonine dehydratase